MRDTLVFIIDLLCRLLFIIGISSPAFSSNYLAIIKYVFFSYIVLIIIRFVLTKLFKANSDTIFEQKKFNLVIGPIFLLTVVTIYILFKETLSIFYLLIFGGTLLTQILGNIKKKTSHIDQ